MSIWESKRSETSWSFEMQYGCRDWKKILFIYMCGGEASSRRLCIEGDDVGWDGMVQLSSEENGGDDKRYSGICCCLGIYDHFLSCRMSWLYSYYISIFHRCPYYQHHSTSSPSSNHRPFLSFPSSIFFPILLLFPCITFPQLNKLPPTAPAAPCMYSGLFAFYRFIRNHIVFTR